MPHPVMYFEIGCRDVASTRDFYRSLFDWEMDESKPNYVGLPKGAAHGIGGHIMALGHEPHQYTLFYVEVEDIAAYAEKAKSLGGKGGSPGGDGSGQVRLDPGQRWQYCRIVGAFQVADSTRD